MIIKEYAGYLDINDDPDKVKNKKKSKEKNGNKKEKSVANAEKTVQNK